MISEYAFPEGYGFLDGEELGSEQRKTDGENGKEDGEETAGRPSMAEAFLDSKLPQAEKALKRIRGKSFNRDSDVKSRAQDGYLPYPCQYYRLQEVQDDGRKRDTGS